MRVTLRSITGVAGAAERTSGGANLVQQAVMVWREIPAPVIAAVHGLAYGGGLQLALAADLRFITRDARLSLAEINWGLVPDMAGYVLIRGLLRDDIARDLIYSGRIFDGDEAFKLGVATRACEDPLAEALAYAREVATRSPHAIRAAKRLFALMADADQSTILEAETDEQERLLNSPNQIEAVSAQFEKRAPAFADPA